MIAQLNWKKGLLSNSSEVFAGNEKIAALKGNTWSQSAKGEINGKQYKFSTKGFIKQETHIIDLHTNEVVGRITYNSWKTEATIDFHGNKFLWHYQNLWHTKGRIKQADETLVRYEHSFTNAEIIVEKPHDLLILSGMYISHYYNTASIAILIAICAVVFFNW